MAFVTYILLSTLLAGLRGAFQPELLGYTASTAFAIVIFEILGLKLGCYLLSISNESQLLDLVAYSGYKFVGIIVSLALGEIFTGGRGTGGWAGWAIFLYAFFANAFFLVSSVPYLCYTKLTVVEVAVTEVRLASGELDRQQPRSDAHGSPIPEEPTDAVPLLVFIHRAVRLYVGSQSAIV